MLYVNNEKVNRVVQGFTIKETLEDTLDHATVVYHSDSAEGFEMYSPAYLELGPKIKAVRLNSIPHQHLDLIDMVLMGPDNNPSTIFKNPIIDTVNKKITFGEIKTTWYAYTGSETIIPHGHPIGLIVGETYPNEQQYLILESFSDYFYMGVNYHKGPGWWQCNAFKYNVEITFSENDFEDMVYETNDSYKIHYLVAEDNSTILGRIPKTTFSHTLTLIEPTKYLERITVSAQAYTNRDDLLVDQIEKALVNAEILRVGEEPRFKISNELRAFLGVTQGEDFFFSTPTTLRDILDEMLSVKNARVRIKKLIDLDNIVLDYDDLALEGGELIALDNNVINIGKYQNLEYLAGNLEVYAQNVEHSEEQSIWHPSAGGWDTFKTNEAELTTSNAFLDTRYPIDYITGFYASVKTKWVRVWYEGNTRNEAEGNLWVTLNLTSRVFDEQAYSALPPTGDISKSNTIAFTRGETEFRLKNTKKIFWTVSNLQSALYEEFYKARTERKNVWLDFLLGPGNYTNEIANQYTFTDVPETFKYDSVLLKVKYVPFINARMIVSKSEVRPELEKLSIYDNQSDKTIELNRFMRQLKDKARQIGNRTMQIDTTSKNISSIYGLGTKFGKYAIVSREYSKYDKYLKVRYTLNEDFKTINERLNITREKRIYDIPLDFIEKNILIKERVLLSTAPISTNYSPKLINSWFIDRLVKTVYGYRPFYNPNPNLNITSEKISSLLVETFKDGSLGRYKLPINMFTSENVLIISAKFLDNFSTGYSTGGKVIGGRKVLYNPYVDSKGEFDTIKFELVKEVTGMLGGVYMTPGFDVEGAKSLPATDQSFEDVNDNTYQVYKDSDESIALTYQLSLESLSSEKENIIIGRKLISNNHNIPTFNREEDLVIYLSKEKYKADETTRVKGELAIDSTIITSSLDGSEYHDTLYLNLRYFGSSNISDFKSWAIGDLEGNLYLAVNDMSLRRVYFSIENG